MGAESQSQRGEPIPKVLCSKHPESGVQIRQPGQLNLPTVGHQPVNQTPFWPFLLMWPPQGFIYDIYHAEVLWRGLGQRPRPGFQTSASGCSAGSPYVWSALFQLASQKGILPSPYYCCWGIVSQQRAGTRNKKTFSEVNHPSAIPVFISFMIHPFEDLGTLLHTCAHHSSSGFHPHHWKLNCRLTIYTGLLNST